MSAIVKCDICGAVVPHTKAKFITIHQLTSATSYYSGFEDAFDVCDKCCKEILNKRKEAAKTDGN